MLDQAVRFAADRYRVCLAVLSPQPPPANAPPEVERVFWMPMPNSLEVAWNVLSRPHHALQEALFMSRRGRAVLADAVRALKPSMILFDMLRTAQYAEDPGLLPRTCRRVLDLDDVLSDRYAQMRRNGTTEVLGAMAGAVPAGARPLAAAIPKLLLGIEERRMHHREEALPRLFDAVMLTSPVEARKFADRVEHPSISACPPAVSVRPLHDRQWQSPRFVFIGADSYAPNAEALKEMDEVAARIKALGVPARFEAAGTVSGRLHLRHVRQIGYVEDLSSFLDDNAILLAPILTGTGVKTKIVEAMARGVPVVTTPKGAEGLDVTPGVHLIVAEDMESMAESCANLWANSQRLKRLARAGHNYACSVHADSKVRESFFAITQAPEHEADSRRRRRTA